jgi:type II secretory pathway component GspD/PulD (secretin)
MFYFKDTPATVEEIKAKLAWLDKPVSQVRLDMTVYEDRDSDLKDIGIDYLAWKNGPGLDIFGAGYQSLRVSTTERFIRSLVGRGINLVGNASWGFGGFYTAPAFDMSFIRILQQNGKATISSTASFLVSNAPGKRFEASFAPEYQNITKNADHTSAVNATQDGETPNYELSAAVHNAVITAGENGCINFDYNLTNSNVVERDNRGVELTEKENFDSATSLAFGKEQLLTSWNRTSNVEQTIGVPFLCELPILKYIFGTTTSNTEITRFFVTVRATPVIYNSSMDPGAVAEFDKVTKK